MADELDKIKQIINGDQGNVKQEYNNATTGLNLDQSLNQVQKGRLTYALNAAVENFDSNSVNYQNEPGNEFCIRFPEGFVLIGEHFIIEKNKHIFFITNPNTGDSQIGYMDNNDCEYRVLVNAPCLNFNVDYPVHKIVHRITNCNTEIYWTDGYNPRRYLDIDDIPKILRSGSALCSPVYTDDLDCNQLKLQPNFNIPELVVIDVISGGNLIAGVYQFAIQYSDPSGNPFTSYYSVTNPTPIADEFIITPNFNYPVGKSIVVNVDNLDVSGQFEYFNLAVIKTINGVTSVDLVGTYFIDNNNQQITYTGQSTINLVIQDIFEKFPFYEIAQDLTAVQDVLVWDQLTSIDRINYQQVANQITLQWETWRIPPTENYANEINATNLRGYLRDEVYAFEIVFLLKNGKQTDGFHIPGRAITQYEQLLPRIPETDPDFIGNPDPITHDSPYWKIYNTASVTGSSPQYTSNAAYKGPYQFGQFSYWESVEEYPCNTDVWGDLAGQKIRHHKFPDVNISPIYEGKTFTSSQAMVMGNDAVFPIGVKLDPQQILSLINTSNLTDDQKADIVGFKIVRGDRSVNKSIVGKGILRNVGEYTREDQSFYFPNYPYNDLNEDPFLTTTNNAYQSECEPFDVYITSLGTDPVSGDPLARVQYYSCEDNRVVYKDYTSIQDDVICAVGKPTVIIGGGEVGYANYDVYTLDAPFLATFTASYDDRFLGPTTLSVGDTEDTVEVVAGTAVICIASCADAQIRLIEEVRSDVDCGGTTLLDGFKDENRYRQIFNSPETSFGQPFLADILKLESVMFGTGKAHFVQVRDNAKYKLLSEAAQKAALDSSARLGAITSPFSATAMFTAYQSYLTIYINGITRRNYAYSFNSIGDYNYGVGVPDNQGIKQRELDIARYLIPGVQAVGDDLPINNWNREGSVFMKTNIDTTALPYPDKSPNMLSGITSIVTDRSRFTISEIGNCSTPAKEEPIQIVSYYASLKNSVVNQWGQIYSYETIDTGYQYIINSPNPTTTVFGGDTFISRFAFKTKLPFFIDNRVNAPDDSDIFYDEIGNVAYPRYWHSARSILENYSIPGQGVMANIISYKAHNFDCPNEVGTDVIISTSTTTTTSTTFPPGGSGGVTPSSTITYYDGYFYLFAYGIPNFYCESSYNLDLRQAFNNREGDFWPHVSTDIPDDWLQQSFVPIAQDNTYYYNTTFSKQNRENTFTHLPPDWESRLCFTNYPFRTIYSDAQNIDADNRVNNWLIYRAISYFDFPQNYGNLVALDGIQNRAILARFENKSLLYNNLLTIDTSNPQAAYVGNPLLFRGAPPIDFAETDLGYVGSQHKMLLKIPQGQVTVDAKRGQVFLIQGTESSVRTEAVDLSAFGSGMNRFFVEHLPFMIYKSFPEVNIDNHFKGIGLHGVYDSVYDRVIITKLDYAPKSKDILYDAVEQEFYINNVVNGLTIRQYIYVSDERYFCNVSWTLSFNMNTKSWISFHSYIPNWYVAENNFFYSGQNNCCEDFDFLVGTLVPNPSTTTTTSTSTSSTTTTSTTVAPLQCNITATVSQIDCSLAGIGQIVSLYCNLAGDGYVGPPTTSTTTSTSTSTTTSTSTSTSTTTSTSTSTTTSTTSSTTTTTTTAEPTTTTTTTTAEPTTTTTTSTSSTTTTTTTPSPTTTTTTTATLQYTFLVYDIDVNCNTSNPQPFWSFTNYANGFYYINGNLSTLYSLQSNTHTNYTNEITQVLAGTCGTTTTTTTTVAPPTTTTTTTTTESPTTTTTTTTTTPSPTTTTTTTVSPYCYVIESVQSAPGECFDCPGYFASTTDTSIKFYDGCGGTQIPAPFDINVTAHYSDASTQTTFIPSGTTGSVLIATSDVQCVAPPTCGEIASPTFDYAVVTPVSGSISECCIGPTPSTEFITTWDTRNTSIYNSSNSNQVRLPLQPSGTYNFNVDWGDSSNNTITTWNQAETLHTYSTPGVYTITINGTCSGFSWGGPTNSNDFEKLLTVVRWGNVNLGNIGNHFVGCVNLDLSTVQDVPNLSAMNTLYNMFLYCSNLTTVNNINSWNVSTITNMSGMFSDATSFNQSLNSWNVSNVTEMSSMFANAYSFNGNITSWNVSSVTQFQSMFINATAFNQNIGSWNVSSAQNMSFMFDSATAFNQNIGGWNIINVLYINDFMAGKSSTNYSTTNLNAIYNGWSTLSVEPGLSIDFGTIKYTSAGQAGKNILTGSPNNWTITDGGI